jgi:hypothetical protein
MKGVLHVRQSLEDVRVLWKGQKRTAVSSQILVAGKCTSTSDKIR